jgi:hypothetical protein
MLYRPTLPSLPRQRMSPTAMVTAGALHVALLWLLLQHSPLQETIRYVVYQYVKPISPNAQSGSSRAITVRPPVATHQADNAPVFSRTPESSVPLKTTTQLPNTLQSKTPLPGPRAPELSPPLEQPPRVQPETPPVEPAPSVPPQVAPVPVAPSEPPPLPAPATVEIAPPVATPAPLPEPPPTPMPAPAPVTVPVPQPVPAPVPAPAPVPVPAPPVVAPPVAAPAPIPEPVAPPAPTAAPAIPAPATAPVPPAAVTSQPPAPAAAPANVPSPVQRLQGPAVDVPAPASSPGSSAATPVPAAPTGPGAGWGTPAPGAPGSAAPRAGPASPALPPAVIVPPAPIVVPAIPPHPGPYRNRQRSLADMANEQLRRGKPKDPLAQGMERAAIDDCLHAPSDTPSVGGVLAAPGLAARALSGRCAK